MSPQCARCGRATTAQDRFCGGCGTALGTPRCGRCGRTLPVAVAFCTGCGAPQSQHTASVPILPSAEDRRRISVLFIDFVGFTPYVERSDPELVRELQTRFFTTARQVVSRYGGVVEKYIGDAVMALFGAPVVTETDAVRCVRAGLELQRALAQEGQDPEAVPRFRVGIATGEALVDVAAARDGGQAIVAGDVVTMASRLQATAPAGGVLVCGVTRAATRSAIRYEEQEPVLLRGRSAPTEVWLAIAPAGTVHRGDDDSTPLVNRSHELGLLVNAVTTAIRDRRPQLVTVIGHAGIGKSRLTSELYQRTEQVTDDPIVWHTGHCPPFGENVTYAAFAEIVADHAGILDTDCEDIARRRLESSLRDLVEASKVDRLLGSLGPLVGLSTAKVSADEAESCWRRFVIALARRRPTVLVFEDLHWADESMLRFIELLGVSVRDVPLLVLCTCRPELLVREPAWSTGAGGTLTITLPPLRDTEIATMYTHLLGQAAFPSEMLRPLVELAHGNPLYAHEYTRMLVENGTLGGTGCSLLHEGVPMPDSVHAVIANRVDLLDPTDRAVLQAASVVGMDFWPGAVAAALGQSTESVERSLRSLEQRDLVREQPISTMADQVEYHFGHVLMRDVCYQRLPRTERIARHERTANWLDRIRSDRTSDLAEIVAHHRCTAYAIARSLNLNIGVYAEPARQATYRAATRAYSLHALDTASTLAGRALSLCDEHTPPAERLQMELLATEIAFYAGGDAFLSGGGDVQLAALTDQLDALGHPVAAARAWTLRGQAAWLRADRRGALAHVGRAVARYARLPDSEPKVEALAELGRLHMLNYERDPALEAAGAAARIAADLGLPEAEAQARITIGTAHYQAGDPEGLDELREVLATCGRRRLLAAGRAGQNLASALVEEGDWPGCERLLTETASAVPGGHNLMTGFSREAQRAWFSGDWNSFMAAAEGVYASPSREWDLQVRGLRSWIGMLRAPQPAMVDGVPGLLVAGERSGFHRLRWTALAHGALTRALQGYSGEATDLLTELVTRWSEVKAIATGEWVPAAAAAAALVGGVTATTLADALALAPRHTPWVHAALHILRGATAESDSAVDCFVQAAKTYETIPNGTERALSLALAIRATRTAPGGLDPELRAELSRFADANQASCLLNLCSLG